MPKARPEPVGARASACALINDPNDPDNDEALHDEIDDTWMDKMHERLCREFARQLIQQERAGMTTNPQNRIANVKALENLQKQYERLLRQDTARRKRHNPQDAKNERTAFLALERRLFAQLGFSGPEEILEESEQ